MPIGDIYRLVQSGLYQGEIRCDNAFFLQSTIDGLTAQDLVDHWVANVLPTWRVNTMPRHHFTSISARRVYPLPEQFAITEGDYPGQQDSAFALPGVCAVVITWQSTSGGRSGRGRTYLAGQEYQTSNGIYITDFGAIGPTAIKNVLLANYGPSAGPGWALGVFSRKYGGSMPPVNPDGFRPVLSGKVQRYICTMGSRRGRRGA